MSKEILEQLNELQEEAQEKRESNEGPFGKQTNRSMYFLGKDVGIARAKKVIRECELE